MFKAIYELLGGENVDPIYASDVYPSVGLFTMIFALVFCIIFYLGLGRWKPIWHKLSHWIITLTILASISVFFALTQAKSATLEDAFSTFMYKFSMVNALYSSIYFIVFSLILKRASIFAKRTPF